MSLSSLLDSPSIGLPSPDPGGDAALGPAYELSAGPYRSGELHVASFEGHEEMNGLYAFEIVVWTKDLDETAVESAVLGQPAVLGMQIPDGSLRAVHGIVAGLAFEGRREGGRHELRLSLVPRLWTLQKRIDSRIFQGMTVQQIADAVLGDVAHDWTLRASYPVRQYCVQYQESDYHFLARILAEAGIFFWFAQPTSAAVPGPASSTATGGLVDTPERLVLCDDPSGYVPIDGDPGLAFLAESGRSAVSTKENNVSDFRVRSSIEPGSVVLRDYDFQRPLLDLTARADASTDGSSPLEVYEHHGEYEESDADAGHARTYLEQVRRSAREARGASACRRLLPGQRFDLADHPIDSLNASYVVTAIDHRGILPLLAGAGRAVYENTFSCVPADVPFRPPRPVRTRQQVVETALVVGPDGLEIFTDAYGRIKVQFHWDRKGTQDEYSSCWIRVAHAWAGTGWGSQFIPRIGMEVLVSFLGGDEDRPVVVGCLYNAQNPVPYGLPASASRSGIRTSSTPGGGGANEISFEDRSGAEQLYLRAERNLDEEVGNDRRAVIRGDRAEAVEGDARSTV